MIKNYWLILLILVVLVAVFIFIFRPQKQAQVIVNGKTFNVEIADNDTERAKGLSGRDKLDTNAGMLFIFPEAGIYPFWMKDTLIPLDIIFIEIDPSTMLGTTKGRIVEMITLDIPKGDKIPKYSPKEKAQYVLELNTGSGTKVGDKVEIKTSY